MRRHNSTFRVALMALALLLLASGCSSQTPPSSSDDGDQSSGSKGLKGCVPACVRGFVTPGKLPTGSYKTRWFFGGQMKVTLHESWTSEEDSTGEFSLSPVTSQKDAVFFWEDVYPLEDDHRVMSVPLTSAGLLRWLTSSPRFDTSSPESGRIGTELPATVVDVSVSDEAVNEDPDCPSAPCVLFLGFPQWDVSWGIAGDQVQRFYLSDVSYGGVEHLFVAVIYPDKAADMDSFAPVGEELLRTVQVPAAPA